MAPDPDKPNREEQVVSLLHEAAQRDRAPESLRREVAALRERAGRPRRVPGLSRPALGAISFGMPAVCAAVIGLVLALGGAGAPSIAQAAAIGSRKPSAPAPALQPGAPSYLSARVGRLRFPNWQDQGGWRSVGERRDTLGNRAVTTVYYAAHGGRIAYSIVSSPVLGGLKTSGEPYETMWRHGRVVVVWQEHDHTCLLSGTGISAARLWHLASAAQSE
jgi:hypothetical protein